MIIKWFKKLIPGYIEIRSMYWVEYGKEMDADLSAIYHQIDIDDYDRAERLTKLFSEKYTQFDVPEWVALKYSEIYRAISMIQFMKGNN